jgi:hypothetical protein
MSLPIVQAGSYKNITATGPVAPGPCQLLGFYVNSTNAGTIILDDGGVAISGTITPAIGYRRFPAIIGNSLTATIGGTALNVTLFYATGH